MGGIDTFEFWRLTGRLSVVAATVFAAPAYAQPSAQLTQAYLLCAKNKVADGADGTDPNSFKPGFQNCPAVVAQMVQAKEAERRNRPARNTGPK